MRGGATGEASLTRRRRRTPEEAEAEIVAAAGALLRERPFRDVTVDEVMRRTELSRPSFYVYFKDRHNLILRVVAHIQDELLSLADRWFKGGQDGPTEVRDAIAGIVDAWHRHGRVMKALADAAADDPGVEAAYGGLIQAFVDSATEHIRDEQKAGKVLPGEPEEMAKALIWMGERYLLHHFGSGPPQISADTITETLVSVFNRSLYGAPSA